MSLEVADSFGYLHESLESGAGRISHVRLASLHGRSDRQTADVEVLAGSCLGSLDPAGLHLDAEAGPVGQTHHVSPVRALTGNQCCLVVCTTGCRLDQPGENCQAHVAGHVASDLANHACHCILSVGCLCRDYSPGHHRKSENFTTNGVDEQVSTPFAGKSPFGVDKVGGLSLRPFHAVVLGSEAVGDVAPVGDAEPERELAIPPEPVAGLAEIVTPTGPP